MKVLVVDDELHNRTALGMLVSEWGYTPVLCADGVAALVELREPNPPQLAILDWLMPRLSGDDFCRRAREEFARQPLHIIMLTGKRVTERDMMLGLKAGADDFLLKPCAPAELQTRLQAGERAVERQNAALQSLASRTTAEAQPHGGTVLCRYCSRIQLEDGSWMDRLVASSIATESRLVAGICDDCVGKQLAQIPVDSL